MLEVKWKKGYAGTLTFKFTSHVNAVVYTENVIESGPRIIPDVSVFFPPISDSGVFAATFRVTAEAIFSPTRLVFKRSHVEELIVWTKRRLFEIRRLDWHAHNRFFGNLSVDGFLRSHQEPEESTTSDEDAN